MGIGRRDLGGDGAVSVTANRPGQTGLLHGSPREIPRVAGLGHEGLEFALLALRVAAVVVVVAVAVAVAAARRRDSARGGGGRVLHLATLSLVQGYGVRVGDTRVGETQGKRSSWWCLVVVEK